MEPLSVKGRARKPNFTNEEIDILLELVNTHRDALLSNNNKAHGVRTKQVIWQQIGADVTLNSDTCQRDAIDVRQKWKDLLRAANKELRGVEAAKENNDPMPSISPYSNRVLQIKTGKSMFTDAPANDDTHSSMGSSFFDAISLKQEPVAIGDGEPSSAGWNQHDNKVKPNFTNKEIRCLITEYDKHKTILQTETNDADTKARQCDIWKAIARTISEKGTERTASECHRKWQKFLYQARKEEQMENEEDETGCSFSKSHFTNLILKVNRIEEEVVESAELSDEFWDSLEDNSGDIDDDSIEYSYLVIDEDSVDNMCDVKNEDITGNDGSEMESTHQNGDIPHPGSSSTPVPTTVQASPLRRTLSPRVHRPDLFSRKRKRPHSLFYNTTRLNTYQSTRFHNPGISNPPKLVNHYKERQELESRRLQLEVEKLELENAIMKTQREKMELEKEKLKIEMEKIAEEKNKVTADRKLVEMNIKVLSQKLHNCDSHE